MPFWLGNTRGRRGLEILQRVIKEDTAAEVKKKAVFGISQSREPQAVDVLIENARSATPTPPCAAESIFWLAQKAGNKAAAAITERIEQDPDTEVKKKAVFALSQLPKRRRRAAADPGRAHATRIRRCANRRCSGSGSRRIRARSTSSRRS